MDDALSRRIEELAGFDDSDSSSSRDDAAVNAVRAEVVAVRADLASLRGEIGSVRADLDGLGGRLTGSVAASRTETGTLVRRVAELTTRVEAVGTRMDEVRTAVPGLGRELREGLDLIPVRTSAALDEVAGRISDGLGSRVDAAIGDVRRTVGTALDNGARSASATQAALVDTRGALEARLANLEDALDAASERMDGLNRDSNARVSERMEGFGRAVAELRARVDTAGAEQVEHTVARLRDVTETGLDALATQVNEQVRVSTGDLRREVTAAIARQERESAETRESVEALVDSVRTALTGFATALTSGLTGLGSTLSSALAESREETRSELDSLTDRLLTTVAELEVGVRRQQVESAGRLDALQAALEARTESVRSGVTSALQGVRADLGSEVGVLRPLLEGVANDVNGGLVAATALRADVLDALESVRERVTTSTTASVQGVRSTLDATRAELTDGSRQLRQSVLDRLEEQHVLLLGRLDTADTAGLDRKAQVDALGQALAEWRNELSSLLARETDRGAARTGEHVTAATATVEQALSTLAGSLEESAATAAARRDEIATLLTGRADELATTAATQAGAAQKSVAALTDGLTGTSEALSASLTDALATQGSALTEAQERLVRRVDDAQGALALRVEELAESIGTRLESTSEAQQLRIDETRALLGERVDELARALASVQEDLASGATDVTAAGDLLLQHLQQHDGAVRDLLWELGKKDTAVPRPPVALAPSERPVRRAPAKAPSTRPRGASAAAPAGPAADRPAPAQPAAAPAPQGARPAAAAKAAAKTARPGSGVAARPAKATRTGARSSTAAAPDLEASAFADALADIAEDADARSAAPKAARAQRPDKVPVARTRRAPEPAEETQDDSGLPGDGAGTAGEDVGGAVPAAPPAEATAPAARPARRAAPRKRAASELSAAAAAATAAAGPPAGDTEGEAPKAAAPAAAPSGAQKPLPLTGPRTTAASRRTRLEQATDAVSPETALHTAAPRGGAPTESLAVGARRQSWSSPPPEPVDDPDDADDAAQEPERRFFRRRR